MPLQQPVGNKWHASHLFVGVLDVIGLHDCKHTWTVTNLVDALDKPFVLVGHSMAGPIARQLNQLRIDRR
jgi:hypothetical protein